MANDALEPMDADAYQNQFKPWLGEKRFRWADENTKAGPPGIRLVPQRLRQAFVDRTNQRGITDAEEKALGLPGDAPNWDQRDIYRPNPG